MAGPILIRGARSVGSSFPAGNEVSVSIENGRIESIQEGAASGGSQVVDASDLWLAPGWIDVQLNDIEWLAKGKQSVEAHAQRIREVLSYQAKRGVTGCILATLAAPLDEIRAYLDGMRLVADSRQGLDDVFLGGLVEGTFMNPELHGAHNPDWVLEPSVEVFDDLWESGAMRMINIAPETSDAAIELIRHAESRGVIVGCGHAKPHAERLREAVDAGLEYIIHLGNGPTGSHWKRFHDGGMLEESLRNDRIQATLIADGWHVHPQLLRDWIARKEISRSIAVSDAGFAMGPPRGRFEVFGITGESAEEGAFLRVVPKDGARVPNPRTSDVGALFGSAILMDRVFENLVGWFRAPMAGVYQREHDALDLPAAFEAASAMCSTNPARLLRVDDERGRIVEGHRADLVLLDVTEGERTSCRVEQVFVGGEAVS